MNWLQEAERLVRTQAAPILAPEVLDPATLRSDVARELESRYGLHGFVQWFWQYAEPGTPFTDNWHVGAICEHLEAVHRREIKDLVINMPPRTGKSLIVDTLFHAWTWAHEPGHRFIAASYDLGLCLRDASRVVDVVNSPEFRLLWPDVTINARAMGNLTTTEHGRRFATTPGSKGTGWGGHTLSCNDPIKPKDASAKLPTMLESVWQWWTGTMANRRDGDPSRFARIVTMQRLAETDLAGKCLDEGYTHLCLPMRYEPNAFWDRGSPLKRDPRTEPGELLFPQVWTKEATDHTEKGMAPADVQAQNQQNPQAKGGGYLDPAWLERHWSSLPTPDPRRFMCVRQYWDFSSKSWQEAGHSRTAGIVVGMFKGRCYLLDWCAGYWNYPAAKKRFEALQTHGYWAWAGAICIEDKANGTPLIDALKDARHPSASKIRRWEPGPLSKEERFALECDKMAAGLWYFPDSQPAGESSFRPSIAEYKLELTGFPTRKPNDLADVTAMALNDLATEADVESAWRAANATLGAWALD